MDFKSTGSRTYWVIGIVGVIVIAIVVAAAMGAFDRTRLRTYPEFAEAVDKGLESRGYMPDVAPKDTTEITIGYDWWTGQYSFAGAVSRQGMVVLQGAVTRRGYEPTGTLAPRVERLKGIDPFGTAQREAIDLRFARVTTDTVEYAAIDSDGQRYYVVRVDRPSD